MLCYDIFTYAYFSHLICFVALLSFLPWHAIALRAEPNAIESKLRLFLARLLHALKHVSHHLGRADGLSE